MEEVDMMDVACDAFVVSDLFDDLLRLYRYLY